MIIEKIETLHTEYVVNLPSGALLRLTGLSPEDGEYVMGVFAKNSEMRKQRDELFSVLKDAMWDDPLWKKHAAEAIDNVIKKGA